MSFATAKLTAMTGKLLFPKKEHQATDDTSTEATSSVGSVSPTSVATSSGDIVRSSPTCVTMISPSTSRDGASVSTSKASNAVDTPRKQQQQPTTTKAPAATVAPSVPKPFFLMDWLEEVNPRDLEIARQMLQTPSKKNHSQSTPDLFGASQTQAESHKSRSAIALPTLAHNATDDSDSVCRQLYPASPPSAEAEAGDMHQQPRRQQFQHPPLPPPKIISRSTSATSNCSSSAAMMNPPVNATPAVVKMSPFKKKSIAIGNGWNAKGLQKAKKGSWESALICWQNALEIREQVLGDSHPDTANTLNNCGIALGKLARFDEAIEVLERALEIRAKHYGTRDHPEVAATLHNIGNVLHQAQDRAGAIQCFWDAKLLQETILGPDHVQVARACVAIGNVYYEAMQYEDAREAYYDALQVFSNAGLASEHAEVLAVQQDVSDIEAIIASHPSYNQAVTTVEVQEHMTMTTYHHHHHHFVHFHPHAQGV